MRQIFVLLSMIFATPAHADLRLEVRANAGGALPEPISLNKEMGGKSVKSIYANGILSGDALVVLYKEGSAGVGVGVRREWQGIVVDGKGNKKRKLDLELKRTAYLLALRFKTTDKFFIGLIGSYGFDHEMKLKYWDQNNELTSYDFEKAETASGGVEFGGKVGPLMFRLETGGQAILYRELKDLNEGDDEDFNVNLGGYYLLLGIGLVI